MNRETAKEVVAKLVNEFSVCDVKDWLADACLKEAVGGDYSEEYRRVAHRLSAIPNEGV